MERYNGVELDPEGAFVYYDDAQRALDALQAQLARWKEALGEWLWNCTNLLGDYHIKTVQDFNEEVNRRIAWLMQHLDYTLPPPMTDEERDRMRKLSEVNDAQRALDAERERLKGQIDYSIQLQQLIESLRRDDTPSPELYHHTIIVEFKRQLATLQARCAHLDVLLRDEYLPKLDVVAVQRSIADRDSRIDALEREVEKLDDDKETLQAQLVDRDAMILQMGEQAAVLAKENMAVKAQLRQVEGQSKQQAEEAVIVFAKDTTLRQLVAALPVVDVQEVSVWLSPDESGWLVSKRPAFPAGLYWAKFRTQAEADSFRALLAYRATLAAKDVHHHTEERHE